jgi:hypothetical protein
VLRYGAVNTWASPKRVLMRFKIAVCFVILSMALGVTRGTPTPTSTPRMLPVPRGKLCVTEGALEEVKGTRLAVTVPKMRAYVVAATTQVAEARLTYLGPTSADAPLGSGAMRRQFGLKLRAQNACNLVYAMWRIEPESKLVVSIKSNPGMTISSQCGNRGYRNIKPRRWAAVPKLRPGDSHSLLAEMKGSELHVSVDGGVVWEGDLGSEDLAFDGPVGVRTDNGHFEFEFLTSEIGAPVPCHTGETE